MIVPVSVEIRRGTARFTEREVGRATRHAFSFGEVYDPARVAFGPMICHDEHLLGNGRGFDTHRHAGLDIVTWVVSGALTHTDTVGGEHTLVAGEVGHLHAGAGVEHSEIAAAPQTRVVQVWLRSADTDGPPSYDVRAVGRGRVDPVGVLPGRRRVRDAAAGRPRTRLRRLGRAPPQLARRAPRRR